VDERLFQVLDAITNPPVPNFNQQLQKRLLLTLQKSSTSLSALLYWNRQVKLIEACVYSIILLLVHEVFLKVFVFLFVFVFPLNFQFCFSFSILRDFLGKSTGSNKKEKDFEMTESGVLLILSSAFLLN
jgi:hypothetical protein